MLRDGRLPFQDRLALVEAVGPAFCLNPREVLFGIAPARVEEWERAARLLGVGAGDVKRDELDAEGVADGGIWGLRRRARFCDQYFGATATISTQPRPKG